MKKALKMIGYSILGLLGIIGVSAILFISNSPQFGSNPNESEKEFYQTFDNYSEGIFQNLSPTNLAFSARDISKMTYRFITGKEERKPKTELEMEQLSTDRLREQTDSLAFSWFGHSSFFMKIGGQNILIDPMFSEVPAPHPKLGNKRFNKKLPIIIDSIPHVDLVLISHDHYDHLDYETIKTLDKKVSMYYVPYGISAHLRKWGVSQDKIKEFNWWTEDSYNGLNLAFTPSRHFSGRGLNNRCSTLWGSWVIQSENEKVFFSGDSGYGSHFKDIGEKYGPFDLSLMECGQYNELWSEIHMMPEETVQAAIDLNSKVMMPIHWGAFSLAMHDWDEPVIKSAQVSREKNIPFISPKIGAWVKLNEIEKHQTKWWLKN